LGTSELDGHTGACSLFRVTFSQLHPSLASLTASWGVSCFLSRAVRALDYVMGDKLNSVFIIQKIKPMTLNTRSSSLIVNVYMNGEENKE